MYQASLPNRIHLLNRADIISGMPLLEDVCIMFLDGLPTVKSALPALPEPRRP
jgi:hypothetical protein